MLMSFVALVGIVFVMMPIAVMLPVFMGIVNCGCAISVKVAQIVTACFTLVNRTSSSSSAMDDMTALMTLVMVWIAPLLRVNFLLPKIKNCPLWCTGIGCIAVDGQNHFTSIVCYHCLALCCSKIE